jgi:signal transduction histidine kinase/CheY-like chemotaxis protein
METARDLEARLIVGEAPKSLGLGIASCWLLAAAMLQGKPERAYAIRVAAWVALLTGAMLRGLWLVFASRRRVPAPSPGDLSGRLQRNGFLAAIAWGLASAFMSAGSDLEHQVILILGIALITMGGSIGRAIHIPALSGLVLVTSVVFALGLIATPGALQLFIGWGYMLFGLVVALFVRAQANTVRRERELNLKIEVLLSRAETATRDAVKAREEADVARSRAESASAAKSRFLATASHDLRQPMHSIGLFVGLLGERILEPETSALVKKVETSVRSMEHLFESLLDISKLDSGSVRPTLGPVDIAALLARLEQTWAPQAEAAGLALRFRPGARLALSDPVLLERIVGNLVSNAIKYTRQGGVLVACRRRQERCLVQVWDTGMGIDLEHLEAIFEEFYRIDLPPVMHAKGLGLGLAIVRRSADLLGHPVRVASVLGRGSLFEVALPLLEWADRQVEPAILESSPISLAGLFVAILDDDGDSLESLAALFESRECHVVKASGCESMLQALAEHLRAPDIVIADHDLHSGLNGLDSIALLRMRFETNLAALIVTASTGSEVAQLAMEAGVGILHKPVGQHALLRAVARVLSNIDDSGRVSADQI